MSLLDYREATPWAKGIQMQLLERRMPPWLPEDGIGDFLRARTLTAREIDTIVDWAVGATPEGGPPPADGAAEEVPWGWAMGEPDLVLAPSEDVVLGEEVDRAVECVVVPTGLSEPGYVAAFEVRAGRPSIVQRVVARVGKDCSPSARPSFSWLSGQGLTRLTAPELFPAGSHLALEILYRKGWNEEGLRISDRTVVALKLGPKAPPVEAVRISAAPHALEDAVDLVAIYPDAEGIDSPEPLRVEARQPDGAVVPLLSIERYDAQWAEKYRLRDPLRLPAGTVIHASRPAAWLDVVRASPAVD